MNCDQTTLVEIYFCSRRFSCIHSSLARRECKAAIEVALVAPGAGAAALRVVLEVKRHARGEALLHHPVALETEVAGVALRVGHARQVARLVVGVPHGREGAGRTQRRTR